MKRVSLVLFVALLAVSVLATAQAAQKAPTGKKTTICHATNSASNPYVTLRVSTSALTGHAHHSRDIIPAPAGGCPHTMMDPHHGGHLLTATLTGHAEIPGPGDPDGNGTAAIRLTPGQGRLCFVLTARNITLPAAAAHIHQGGATVAGPVVVPLSPPDASGRSEGCVAVDRALATAILANPSGYYANVHTSDYPAGAIRGQLQLVP